MASLVAASDPASPPTWRSALQRVAVAAVASGISGFVVGGVLARGAMRVLALTSPVIAQGRLTDDAARVGEFTMDGSLRLAVSMGLGSALVVTPVYLLACRVLPSSRRGRVIRFALLTGSFGGAVLVHGHPSFDYSILKPEWLAVAFFVAIPTVAGALTAYLAETWSPAPGASRRGPIARAWRSTAVTVAGTTCYWLVVAWGLYNIGVDALSMARDTAMDAPWTV